MTVMYCMCLAPATTKECPIDLGHECELCTTIIATPTRVVGGGGEGVIGQS